MEGTPDRGCGGSPECGEPGRGGKCGESEAQGAAVLVAIAVALRLLLQRGGQGDLARVPAAAWFPIMLLDELLLSEEHARQVAGHGAGGGAVQRQNCRDEDDTVVLGDAEPQVTIFGGAHGFVEETNSLNTLAAESDGGAGEGHGAGVEASDCLLRC